MFIRQSRYSCHWGRGSGCVNSISFGQKGKRCSSSGKVGTHLWFNLARSRTYYSLSSNSECEESSLGQSYSLQSDHGRNWPRGWLPSARLTEAWNFSCKVNPVLLREGFFHHFQPPPTTTTHLRHQLPPPSTVIVVGGCGGW